MAVVPRRNDVPSVSGREPRNESKWMKNEVEAGLFYRPIEGHIVCELPASDKKICTVLPEDILEQSERSYWNGIDQTHPDSPQYGKNDRHGTRHITQMDPFGTCSEVLIRPH